MCKPFYARLIWCCFVGRIQTSPICDIMRFRPSTAVNVDRNSYWGIDWESRGTTLPRPGVRPPRVVHLSPTCDVCFLLRNTPYNLPRGKTIIRLQPCHEIITARVSHVRVKHQYAPLRCLLTDNFCVGGLEWTMVRQRSSFPWARLGHFFRLQKTRRPPSKIYRYDVCCFCTLSKYTCHAATWKTNKLDYLELELW